MGEEITLYISYPQPILDADNNRAELNIEIVKIRYEAGTFYLLNNEQIQSLHDGAQVYLGNLQVRVEGLNSINAEPCLSFNKTNYNSNTNVDSTLLCLQNLSQTPLATGSVGQSADDPLSFLQAPFIPQLKLYSEANAIPLAGSIEQESKFDALDHFFQVPPVVNELVFNENFPSKSEPQSSEQANILRDLGFI